jgi:hypothetical protein
MTISPPLSCNGVQNVVNGLTRPYIQTNAWIADLNDENPRLLLNWNTNQVINSITFFFDTDYDHPMESTQQGHPEDVIPFVIREYRILDEDGRIIYEKKENYQTRNKIIFKEKFNTRSLTIEFKHPTTYIPASVFEIFID